MRRGAQNRAHRPLQHRLARVEDLHPVADPRDHAHVVADTDHRHVARRGQIAEQVEDVGLRRDVEAGGRLVQQERIRLAGKRHGDGHALLLSARQFVRVAAQHRVRIGQAHLGQKVVRPAGIVGLWQIAMQVQCFADLLPDAHRRGQRLSRALRDEAQLSAADALQLACGPLEHVGPVIEHSARHLREPMFEIAQGGQGQRALAGPTFADDANALAGADLQIDLVQHLQQRTRAPVKSKAKLANVD